MSIKSELKSTFTSYWKYMALRSACILNIFDEIQNGNNSIEKLMLKINASEIPLETLLSFLIENKTIFEKNKKYFLLEKGKFLTKNHPETLKESCILWGGEHLNAWQNLSFTIQKNKPAFENIFKSSFFDYLKNDNEKLYNYQYAMAEYARDDYKNITDIIDFSKFDKIADIGGSKGVLIKNIAKKFPKKNCILLDLPEVTNLIKIKPDNLKIISESFFEDFNFKADAIILSRVLHDWNNEKAKIIIQNCIKALNYDGRIFIIEIMNDEIKANLLSINMMLMTESYERTFEEYNLLLEKFNFKIELNLILNKLQTILICKKK